jgi:DNA-binding CsgD family transcriptional regulator
LRAAVGLEFVARCRHGDLAANVADFRQTIGIFGFTASACGACVGAGKRHPARFFFLDWPQDWHDLYMSRGWLAHDFVVAEAGRRMMPFSWDAVRAERTLTTAEAEVYAAARAYGWTDLFAVPVHGPAGYQGLVTMASRSRCPLLPEDEAALHVMALTIHQRCRAEIGFGQLDGAPIKLRKREIECLRWVAIGKSDREIGDLLGISATTAHYHVEQAKKKLGVSSRQQAVALLVLTGEI